MDKFIRTATTGRPPPRADDNWVDRLSSRYTVLLLLAFTILISIASWVRNPMTCWFPKNFDIIHREYLHSHCWVADLYYLPYTSEVPKVHEQRRIILYYQWVPWILLTQAFLFWCPSLVWHWLSGKSGLDTNNIISMAQTLQNTKLDTRSDRVTALAKYLDYFLTHREHFSNERDVASGRNSCCRKCRDTFKGCSLSLSYIFTKLLYCANLAFQLFALSGLLKTHYYKHGPSYIAYLYGTNTTEDGQVWNSPVFPRVAFCDYIIPALGNKRQYTAQCVLPFNIYMERLYLFLWFWILFLSFFTVVDLFIWFLRTAVRQDRLSFILNQLYEGDQIMNSDSDREITKEFVDKYLRHDGTFVLRLIVHNTNAITACEITGKIWELWKNKRQHTCDIEDQKASFDKQIHSVRN